MPTSQNITITIPNPVLNTGQYFSVRYKLHNSISWTLDLTHHTNAPFTLNGLIDGDWDIGYTLVNADGSTCPERIDHFTLFTPGCPCLTNATGVVEQISANNFQIRVNFTPPSSQPGCGWIINLTDSNGIQTSFSYQTLTSPLIIPITVNSAYLVEILADCCGRNLQQCAMLDLSKAIVSTCVHSLFPPIENQLLLTYVSGQYYLQLTCTQQSNPVSPTFKISYEQIPTTGVPGADTGIVTVTPTGTAPNILCVFPVNPNPLHSYAYRAHVYDICGQWFDVNK
jgi:hypothetical protein